MTVLNNNEKGILLGFITSTSFIDSLRQSGKMLNVKALVEVFSNEETANKVIVDKPDFIPSPRPGQIIPRS